jgi:hypothetical protein
MTDEISPAGVRIMRYEKRPRPRLGNAADYSADLERHVEKTIGPIKGVIHEIIPDRVSIEILIIGPTPERDCWSFVTLGASAFPMPVPDGVDEASWRRAEYIISLPTDWAPLDVHGLPATDSLDTWYPLAWLKKVARAPSLLGAWFSAEHTVPNGDPPEALAADTGMSGFLLYWPITAPDAARAVAQDGEVINLFALIGVTSDELKLARERGASALIDGLEQADVDDVFAPHRPSVEHP